MADHKRGRPRSRQADQSLREAALQVFVEDGLEALSMEKVAKLAGVSKLTLYRRWPSKVELVRDVLAHLSEQVPIADTGSLRTDLLALLHQAYLASTASPAGHILPRLVGEIATHPALLDVYQQAIMGPRLQHLSHLIERARARGEIRREVSNEVAAAMIAGPLFYHLILIQPLGGPEVAQLLEHLADAALYGIAARSSARSRR